MFPAVNTPCLGLIRGRLLVLLLVAGLSAPASAGEARYAYLHPSVPVSLQALFTQSMSQHPLWQIELESDERQILRLQTLELKTQAPFYWSRTRLDERAVQLDVQVGLEIWRGPELAWQRSVAITRPLRLTGPELRGTGLSLVSPLAELPAGALSSNASDAAVLQRLQRELLFQAAQQLLNDYRHHHMTTVAGE